MATATSTEKQLREEKRSSGFLHCFRCKGLMVVEQGFDSLIGTAAASSPLQRCVQCGEVIDAVILQNRRAQLRNHLQRVPR